MDATTDTRRPDVAHDDPDRSGNPGGTFGRLVGSVVSPIVGNIDIDEVIDQIDVNDVVERIDIDEVVGRIDIDAVVGRIDIDAVVGRIDADQLLDRIDPDRLLDRVDPNALLDRVDANRLLDRVDANRLLDRVDANRLLDRVDPDALLERVDVNKLVDRTELGEIIARSTTGVFSQILDVARAQIIGTDQIAQGVPARVLRGVHREMPPRADGVSDDVDPTGLSSTERAVVMQHRFSGSISRFLAFLIDQFVIGMLFGMGALLVQSAIRVVFRSEFEMDEAGWPVVAAFALWWFAYTAGSIAATGRTLGKAILGVKVVDADGTRVSGRRASLRTLVFPLSFLLLGIGFLIGLVRRDRRELHDLIASTGVIYSWDADTAQLRAGSD